MGVRGSAQGAAKSAALISHDPVAFVSTCRGSRTACYSALTSRSPCFESAFATGPSGKSLFTWIATELPLTA